MRSARVGYRQTAKRFCKKELGAAWVNVASAPAPNMPNQTPTESQPFRVTTACFFPCFFFCRLLKLTRYCSAQSNQFEQLQHHHLAKALLSPSTPTPVANAQSCDVHVVLPNDTNSSISSCPWCRYMLCTHG